MSELLKTEEGSSGYEKYSVIYKWVLIALIKERL